MRILIALLLLFPTFCYAQNAGFIRAEIRKAFGGITVQVDRTALSDGDVLTYNDTTKKWEAAAAGGGGGHDILSTTHTDVVVSTPSIRDILEWNGSAWQAVGRAHTLMNGLTHSDTENINPNRGDLIIGDPNNTSWSRLSQGGENTVLQPDSNGDIDWRTNVTFAGYAYSEERLEGAAIVVDGSGSPNDFDPLDIALEPTFTENGISKVLDGAFSGLGGFLQGRPLKNATTGTTALTGIGDSARIITNRGATGVTTFTLPDLTATGATGAWFTFRRNNGTHAMRVDPQATQAIVYTGGTMANGEYLELSTDHSILTLINDGTNWISIQEIGNLVEETP